MGLQIQGAISPDLTDLEQRVQAAHDLAVEGVEKATEAQATGQNARTMVLNRDPVLTSLQDVASKFTVEIARTDKIHDDLQYGINLNAGAISALQSALSSEAQQRASADSAEAAARRAAGDAVAARATALETAVAALQKLNVIVGFGVANLPASLAAGATTNVTVPLSKDMGSTTYSVGYGLAGGVSLLGSLQITGVVGQTKTNVTVAVKNAGLSALLNLSTASVSVVAAREG